MIDLRAQYQRIKDEVDAAVAEVFATQGFVGGPKIDSFEQSVTTYLGGGHAVAVASGTDALLLALKAAGIQSGDEVITTPFSFFATAGAIVNAGATPVFADIDPITFNISPEKVAARITPNTRALMPVHLYGQCADMDALRSIARQHHLAIIEDAAQSFGARYKGAMAGLLGDLAAVSFYPTKNLGGAGDGGMVVASDAAVAANLRLLRSHGAGSTYYHTIVGTNSRLDAIQAAVLLVKLKYLDKWNEQRRLIAEYYTANLKDLPGVTCPTEMDGNYHIYHQYVVRVPRRDAACEYFRGKRVGCAVFYPLPLHRQECFRHYGYDEDALPEASRACREVLALPMYAELTRDQQDLVIETLRGHVEKNS
jgi:dTDP-4-amino-4,6-dideoxygalactose transaminase